jgi:uncharacterized membrane protein YozB (DUF420 family)
VKKFAWGFLFLLGAALTINALMYLNFDPHYGFLEIKKVAVASGYYLPFYYMHVILGGLILLVGFAQVSTWFRNKWTRLHRMLGKFYVYGVLLFAAPGGCVMSFFVDRGVAVLMSFLFQTVLWFYFTSVAVIKIKQGNVAEHEVWMWRSFALTLAAITLRLYIFFASYFFDLSQPIAYAIIAWASWVPNWLAVEYYFQNRRIMQTKNL